MKTTKNPWSPFWLKGNEASFLGDKSTLQRYQMRKFWLQALEQQELKQPVVDVGCGNGILVQWVTEFAEQNELKMDVRGIDSAELKPLSSELNVAGETPYETFQLKSNRKVGTFVSNYGLEYGSLDTGLEHLQQQLKRGGQLLALLHNEDSVIVKNSKAMLELLPSLIKQLKKSVQPLQQGLLKEGPGKLSKSSIAAQNALNQFVQKHKNVGAFHAANFFPVTEHLLKMAAKGQRQTSEAMFDEYLQNVERHKERLQTVIKASSAVDDPELLTEKLTKAGFKNVSIEPVEFAETGVVGQFLSASK